LKTITAVITHNVAIAAMADRVIRISSGAIADIHKNDSRVSPAELMW
jgi:putative ABC transport system ATP-binding protein